MHAKYLVLCMLSVWFYASLSLFMICIIYASLSLNMACYLSSYASYDTYSYASYDASSYASLCASSYASCLFYDMHNASLG